MCPQYIIIKKINQWNKYGGLVVVVSITVSRFVACYCRPYLENDPFYKNMYSKIIDQNRI